MPDKRVEFHPQALETEAAADWYRQRSERAGQEFLDELEKAVDAITKNPERWPRSVADTRRYLLKRFPFSVVYRPSRQGIQVIAAAHSRRRPAYWRER